MIFWFLFLTLLTCHNSYNFQFHFFISLSNARMCAFEGKKNFMFRRENRKHFVFDGSEKHDVSLVFSMTLGGLWMWLIGNVFTPSDEIFFLFSTKYISKRICASWKEKWKDGTKNYNYWLVRSVKSESKLRFKIYIFLLNKVLEESIYLSIKYL